MNVNDISNDVISDRIDTHLVAIGDLLVHTGLLKSFLAVYLLFKELITFRCGLWLARLFNIRNSPPMSALYRTIWLAPSAHT